MPIYELDPKHQFGPFEIGRERGLEVTEFPQFKTFKASHLIGWSVLDNHLIYNTHDTLVEILSPDEIGVIRCLHQKPCLLINTWGKKFSREIINQQPILNGEFRWVKMVNT